MCEFCGDGPTCIVCGRGLPYRPGIRQERQSQLDYLAGLATQGIIAGRKEGGHYLGEKIARDAYAYARAMMQEREAHINQPKVQSAE